MKDSGKRWRGEGRLMILREKLNVEGVYRYGLTVNRRHSRWLWALNSVAKLIKVSGYKTWLSHPRDSSDHIGIVYKD